MPSRSTTGTNEPSDVCENVIRGRSLEPLIVHSLSPRVSTRSWAIRSAVSIAVVASAVSNAGTCVVYGISASISAGASSGESCASSVARRAAWSTVRPSTESVVVYSPLSAVSVASTGLAVDRRGGLGDRVGELRLVIADDGRQRDAAEGRLGCAQQVGHRLAVPAGGQRVGHHGVDVRLTADLVVADRDVAVGAGERDRPVAERPERGLELGPRLLGRQAREIDLADAHAGKHLARVLLPVGVQGPAADRDHEHETRHEGEGEAHGDAAGAGRGRGMRAGRWSSRVSFRRWRIVAGSRPGSGWRASRERVRASFPRRPGGSPCDGPGRCRVPGGA